MVRQNAPVHETAVGIVTEFVAGRSLMCQSLPFQMAALGSASTVTQAVALAQETSSLPPVFVQDFQAWPFQVSAMGPDLWRPTPLMTAQNRLLGQLTSDFGLFGPGVMKRHVVPFQTTAPKSPAAPNARQKVRVGQDTFTSPSPGGSFS